MIKKEFIIATGSVDSDGDIVMPNAIVMPESKTLPILDHFDYSKKIGVITKLKNEGNNCVAIGMFNEDPTGLYPAMAFIALRAHTNAHGGKTFDEIKLISIGITQAPNADPNIKPIA